MGDAQAKNMGYILAINRGMVLTKTKCPSCDGRALAFQDQKDAYKVTCRTCGYGESLYHAGDREWKHEVFGGKGTESLKQAIAWSYQCIGVAIEKEAAVHCRMSVADEGTGEEE
jgi:hypothetical protein